jgi:host factor-I protein
MKNGMESTAAVQAPEPEAFSNRKLIRPSLSREHVRTSEAAVERRERAERAPSSNPTGGKKTPPPEQTHAENFYYQKQMQSKTQMVVVLNDGEEIHGVIEWYDKSCIKLTRAGGSNLLLYKPSIKYMYKESEGSGRK